MNISAYLVGLSLALAGCASVPMGDPKRDTALKEFVAPLEMVGVYIYRDSMFGAAYSLDVLIDGVEVGTTAARTFLYREVAPGKHTVTSKGENRDTVEIEAKRGTLVFVWQEAKFGVGNIRSKLHVVSDQEGKRGVQASQLAVQ